MSSDLVILSDIELENYISSLDLKQGTEEYRTLTSMLLLSPNIFSMALSAIYQGLINFSHIRSLPAVNDHLVEKLIISRLSSSDLLTLTYNYRTIWFPASVNVVNFKESIPFNITEYLKSKLNQFTQFVMTPEYDFLNIDETKYSSYKQAQAAYFTLIYINGASQYVEQFINYHNEFKLQNPDLVQVNDNDNPILLAVLSLLDKSVFLQRPDNTYNFPILHWLLSNEFEFISYNTFNKFLSDLYVIQAENEEDDPLHNGEAGATVMYMDNSILPINKDAPQFSFAYQQLASYYLPNAYGNLILSSEALQNEYLKINTLKSYLRYAREMILKFRASLTEDAITGHQAGSPIGLLLSLTYDSAYWIGIENLSTVFPTLPDDLKQVPGSPVGLLLTLTHP
jgi:hypothetical protein